MDWVETTGKSIDEAMDRALAHLGVHRDDAEIEVLEEPKAGMFGRVKGEARVRARVIPSSPRPKRSRRPGAREDRGRSSEPRTRQRSPKKTDAQNGDVEVKRDSEQKRPAQDRDRQVKNEKKGKAPKKEEVMAEGMSLAEQGAVAKEFLEGLLGSMGITAHVDVREIDEETVEVAVNADPPTELGVLVGPRGTTLQALQEVTRTVVQSKSAARTDRILVDVAQYRERRVAALGRFASQVASEVLETGEERALEPMSAADRKAVHDALSSDDKIVTRSEGEEPRRFVVVAPA